MGDLFASIYDWCYGINSLSRVDTPRLDVDHLRLKEHDNAKQQNKTPLKKKLSYHTKVLKDSVVEKRNLKRYPYGGKEKSPFINLTQAPGWIPINGPLAKKNINTLYDAARKRLTYLQMQFPKQKASSFQRYIDKSFLWRAKRWHIDLAFAYQIQVCKAAEDILGDKSFYKRSEELLKEIHDPKHNVKNQTLLESMLYKEMFLKALATNKRKNMRKMSKWASKTNNSVQNCQPCAWTAISFESNAQYNSYVAFVFPEKRHKHNRLTYECYRISREHYIMHDNDIPGSYSWVYCLFQMQNALLQMPLRRHLEFVVNEPKKNIDSIINQNIVKKTDLNKSRMMLEKLQDEFKMCDSKYRSSYIYNLFLAVTYLELRSAQAMRRSSNFAQALKFTTKAIALCTAFQKESEPDAHVFFISYLRKWIKYIFDYLYNLQHELMAITMLDNDTAMDIGASKIPQDAGLSEYLLKLVEYIFTDSKKTFLSLEGQLSQLDLDQMSPNTESVDTEI